MFDLSTVQFLYVFLLFLKLVFTSSKIFEGNVLMKMFFKISGLLVIEVAYKRKVVVSSDAKTVENFLFEVSL